MGPIHPYEMLGVLLFLTPLLLTLIAFVANCIADEVHAIRRRREASPELKTSAPSGSGPRDTEILRYIR